MFTGPLLEKRSRAATASYTYLRECTRREPLAVQCHTVRRVARRTAFSTFIILHVFLYTRCTSFSPGMCLTYRLPGNTTPHGRYLHGCVAFRTNFPYVHRVGHGTAAVRKHRFETTKRRLFMNAEKPGKILPRSPDKWLFICLLYKSAHVCVVKNCVYKQVVHSDKTVINKILSCTTGYCLKCKINT